MGIRWCSESMTIMLTLLYIAFRLKNRVQSWHLIFIGDLYLYLEIAKAIRRNFNFAPWLKQKLLGSDIQTHFSVFHTNVLKLLLLTYGHPSRLANDLILLVGCNLFVINTLRARNSLQLYWLQTDMSFQSVTAKHWLRNRVSFKTLNW